MKEESANLLKSVIFMVLVDSLTILETAPMAKTKSSISLFVWFRGWHFASDCKTSSNSTRSTWVWKSISIGSEKNIH